MDRAMINSWMASSMAHWRARLTGRDRAAVRRVAMRSRPQAARSAYRLVRLLRRWWFAILGLRLPSGVGLIASLFLILGALGYGAVAGDHIPAIVAAFKDARDATADAAGFRIASIALSGERHVSREEILATVGVTGTSSLLFFDVDQARDQLKTNPWIADATVLKLYPDRLQIGIKEREAFALWQKNGRVGVIAGDGTVLEPYVNPGLLRLPLVVGRGAAERAKDILTVLDHYPELRDLVRASVLIGERRWNLRLRNGLDIRLPETDVDHALAALVALDRDKKLLTRDIVAIDLRLPDRVTLQLSDSAAAARADALKDKKPAKKGGSA
jgi:cell division protein FtsQ